MDQLVTIDTILEWIEKQVQERHPIDGHMYMEIAFKINALLQGEQEKLFEMESEVANMRKLLLEDPNMPVNRSKSLIEASNEFLQAKKQKAKIDRAIELIRLCKQNARIGSEVFKSQM